MTTTERAQRVLIVEDDPGIQRFLRLSLEAHAFRIHEALTGEDALQAALAVQPDLIILDLGLPGIGGTEVTIRLREWTQTPILVLSVQNEESTKIAALDAGADDYLTKPFSVQELLARIRAALRRANRVESGPVFTCGDLSVDLAARLVRFRGSEVHLTRTEFSLMKVMVLHADRVLTHRQLVREVWGRVSYEDARHLLQVNISNLRCKLEEDPSRPRHIITESGVGYRLRTQPLSR